MRASSWVSLFLVSFLLLFSACDDSGGSEENPSPGGETSYEGSEAVEAFERDYERAICEHRVGCEPISQEECERIYNLSVDSNWIEAKIDEAAGVTRFDPDKATACLEGRRNLPCGVVVDEYVRVDELCAAIFQGTLAAGSSCWSDQACVSGECTDQCGNMCCEGTCTSAEKPKPGEDCEYYSVDDECEEGSYCAKAGEDDGVCKSRVPEGTACSIYEVDPCQEGFLCVATGMDQAACALPPEVGEDCAGTDCDEGAFCNEQGICALKGEEGASCYVYNSSPCVEGLMCYEGVCRGALQEGEACDELDDYCDIGEQLSCNAGTCQRSGKAGDACSLSNFEFCARGLNCVEGSCEAAPLEGGACDQSEAIHCASGLACEEGRCVTRSVAAPCER